MLMEPSGGIGSPAWWFSAVFVGLVVHLAASYLKPRIDAALLRGSSWWRSRSALRIAERDSRIAELVEDDRNMALAHSRMLVGSLDTILWFVGSIGVVLLGLHLRAFDHSPWLTLVAIVAFVILYAFAYRTYTDVARENRELHAAEYLRKRDPESEPLLPPSSSALPTKPHSAS